MYVNIDNIILFVYDKNNKIIYLILIYVYI